MINTLEARLKRLNKAMGSELAYVYKVRERYPKASELARMKRRRAEKRRLKGLERQKKYRQRHGR